ncbi:transposase [soil metagenome]
MENYQGHRNSHLEKNKIYFWTATIHEWKNLIVKDEYKRVTIDSLKWLVHNKLAEVYAFVIMPNHIHLVWQILKNNGKESPQGSLLKYTAHTFRKMLYKENREMLKDYEVQASNKEHEFWQRDSLAIPMFSKEVIFQKIEYIHNNPQAGKWNLTKNPESYKYSSASFYTFGIDTFGILTHVNEVL